MPHISTTLIDELSVSAARHGIVKVFCLGMTDQRESQRHQPLALAEMGERCCAQLYGEPPGALEISAKRGCNFSGV